MSNSFGLAVGDGPVFAVGLAAKAVFRFEYPPEQEIDLQGGAG